MKQLGIILLLLIAVIACSDNKKKTPQPEVIAPQGELVSFKYKVDGLQDSVIADSVWKMIFSVEGIDKLIISRADCTVVFTVDPELLTSDSLKLEITSRGGELLN